MSGSLFPAPLQYFDNDGQPAAGGKLYTYIAGTSTPKTTWSDRAKTTPHTNPIILDAAGRTQFWGDGGYKLVAKSAADVTLFTQDDVFVTGNTIDGTATINGDMTVVGDTDITGDSSLTGELLVDHSSSSAVGSVKFTHSNIWLNTDPYGTNAVVIEATGLNNNQPVLHVKYNVNTASFGNVGPVIQNIGGTTAVSTDALAATIELVANNPNTTASTYTPANGKWELGSLSGRDAGDADLKDGYFYISPRRSDLNPSGVNTGFDGGMFAFLPASVVGGGRFQTEGRGIEVTPRYDYTADSILKFLDNFNNSVWTNQVTTTGKYARIENAGMGDSYIRTQSDEGQASVYIQSETDNKVSLLEVRSNWVTPGTGSARINLYTDADGTGFQVQSNGSNGALNIRAVDSGTVYENVDISPSADGLVSIYRNSDYTKGRLRLSNGAGAAGGGTLDYDSNTGILNLTGTNVKITVNNSNLARLVNSAPANTAAAGEAGDYAITASFLYVYKAGTGWVRTAVATF